LWCDAGRRSTSYGERVDHAIYTLNIVRPDGVAELVPRLRERLAAQDAPAIEIDHRPAALRFTCPTWRPTLISRVNDAIDAEVGAEQRETWFKPF
jgi:hypothetical protein